MKVVIAAFLFVSAVSCGDKKHVIQSSESSENSKSAQADTLSPIDTTDVFIVNTLLTPDQIINQKGVDCLLGMRKAQADRAKGIIGYYFWGESIPLYADTLENKYGMTIHRSGCSINLEEEAKWICYNHFMDSIILAKYHVNIIAQEEHKSQEWIRASLFKRRFGSK